MAETIRLQRAPSRRPYSSPVFTTGPTWIVFSLVAFVIFLAIVLGGGARQGRWSDAAVQIVGLFLIVVLVFRTRRQNWRNIDSFAIVLVAAIVLLPLVQLIRLPPSFWGHLPGREMFALTFSETGIASPWLPVSLAPEATWRSWLSLIPVIAVFFATLALDRKSRRRLSLLVITLGVVSVILGLAQLMQGSASQLRLYPFTNSGDSVGFFANRNHYAAFLTVLIPIVAAWAIGIIHDRRANRQFGLAACLIVLAVLLIGIGIARSRAGVVLALLAIGASFLLIPAKGGRMGRYSVLALGGTALVGLALATELSFFRVLARFESDVLADLRFKIAEITASAVWSYFPVGTGFGTFADIYRIFEPRDALQQSYVNHAHNDWLEILLEGGLPAGILLIAFLVWFAMRSVRVWRQPASSGSVLDQTLVKAATISTALLLLFSFVDYPLRTTTVSVVLAWLTATLVASRQVDTNVVDDRHDRAIPTRRPHNSRSKRRSAGTPQRSFQ